MNDQEKLEIIEVLCGQALADHLGDVRDEEVRLWKLLGIDKPIRDYDDAYSNTLHTLREHNLPIPNYYEQEEDDDE